ncbi:MAG: class I SAM-dependent methyltransferase [Pyrinomonadaceae bacterium]
MSSAKEFLKWTLTLGREPQTFLGARWIRWALNRAPASTKRLWAFRLLSLSPHYFLDRLAPDNRKLPEQQYFERAAAEWLESRSKFFDVVLKERLSDANSILDYGCGPGFLAVTLAKHFNRVFACDISSGALDCARVLNSAKNLTYILATDSGLAKIHNESLDGVVSLAVIQHLSRESYEQLLAVCYQKLKSGGRLVVHVQLDEGVWKKEDDWKQDRSMKGRLKYSYGLHNFGRPEEEHLSMAAAAGFTDASIEPLSPLFSEGFEDIGEQHLLSAIKP